MNPDTSPAKSSSHLLVPQALEVERDAVAMLMRAPKRYYSLRSLRSDHFHHPAYAAMFAAIASLSEHHLPVNILTIAESMSKAGTLEMSGGASAVAEMQNARITGDLLADERIILDRWQRRGGIHLAQLLLKESADPESSTAETYGFITSELDRIAAYAAGVDTETTADQIRATLDYTKNRSGAPKPVFFGIAPLDELMDAVGGSLVTLSGSTGSGKSSAYNTILHAAVGHNTSAYSWSGENSVRVQLTRLISAISGIDGRDIKQGRYVGSPDLENLITHASDRITDSGIVFEGGSLTAERVLTKINYLSAAEGIKLFLFDRLELIDVSALSRDVEQGRSEFMQRIRVLASELDIVIVIACQLRKSYESRPNCEPDKTDLKGTSAIGDSATHIVMLTRPEYHGITEYPDGSSTAGMGKIMIQKNTEGEVGDMICRFDKTLTLWKDYDPDADFDLTLNSPAQPYGYGAISTKQPDDEFIPF